MRKKGRAVPEWLNSPIWSATPPAPAPPDPYGVDLAPPPPLKPPPPAVAPPVPPPPSYEQAVGAGGGRGDEEDEGAGAVIRAQLLSDFKAAVRAGKAGCWLSLGFSLSFSCLIDSLVGACSCRRRW